MKNRSIALALFLFYAVASGMAGADTGCTKEELQPCKQINALAREKCLMKLVKDLKACGGQLDRIEDQLAQEIRGAAAKTKDPLLLEKALLLTKLEQLRAILDWHHLDVKGTIEQVAGFIGSFETSYRPREKTLSIRLMDLSKLAHGNNVDELFKIKNDVRLLLEEERSQATLNGSLANALILELEDRERFVKSRLEEYSDFLEQSEFAESVPDFSKERAMLASIKLYIDMRLERIGQAASKLSQGIQAKIKSLRKAELEATMKETFALGRKIAEEEGFYRKVDGMVVKAFQHKDYSSFHGQQYLAERFAAVLEFNTLKEICIPGEIFNDWRAWGCQRYQQYRESGIKFVTTIVPKLMRNGLEMMSWDDSVSELVRNDVKKAIEAKNLQLAVQLYDRALGEAAGK